MTALGTSRNLAGVLTITFFAALSVGSGSSKTDSSKGGAAGATSGAVGAAGGDPSKGATLVGSCDRSDQFYADCTESYAPLHTAADAKSECKSLGGKFRQAPCPLINAVSQCFEGNEPALSSTVAYEGRKTKQEAGDCPRGFKDFKKEAPAVKVSSSPASCNAVATAGTCTIFSAVNADVEKACLDGGGRLKQPPEACPAANGLTSYKLQTKGGWTETDYFYSTPYNDVDGTHTWKMEDAMLVCVLAGAACTKIPFNPAADVPGAAAAASAPAAAGAKAKAAPANAPAKSAAKK